MERYAASRDVRMQSACAPIECWMSRRPAAVLRCVCCAIYHNASQCNQSITHTPNTHGCHNVRACVQTASCSLVSHGRDRCALQSGCNGHPSPPGGHKGHPSPLGGHAAPHTWWLMWHIALCAPCCPLAVSACTMLTLVVPQRLPATLRHGVVQAPAAILSPRAGPLYCGLCYSIALPTNEVHMSNG